MNNLYSGGCLCGAIRFEVVEFLPYASHCHCTMCRKFHGAAYATYASVSKDKFIWLQGENFLQKYTAENGTTRSFCQRCGSSLLFHSPRGKSSVIEIAIATFDGEIPVKPRGHIYFANRANWTVISDELPKFESTWGGAVAQN